MQQWRNINLNPSHHPSWPPSTLPSPPPAAATRGVFILLFRLFRVLHPLLRAREGRLSQWPTLFMLAREFLHSQRRFAADPLFFARFLFVSLRRRPCSSALIRRVAVPSSFVPRGPLWILSAYESFRRDNGRPSQTGRRNKGKHTSISERYSLLLHSAAFYALAALIFNSRA